MRAELDDVVTVVFEHDSLRSSLVSDRQYEPARIGADLVDIVRLDEHEFPAARCSAFASKGERAGKAFCERPKNFVLAESRYAQGAQLPHKGI
jgi:hypothetical protein